LALKLRDKEYVENEFNGIIGMYSIDSIKCKKEDICTK